MSDSMSKTSYLLASEPGDDLRIADAMIQEMEPYILNDDVYRTIIVATSSGDQKLQMTIGDLLSRLHRLSVQSDKLSSEEQSKLVSLTKQMETLYAALRSRYDERLQREIKTRLNSLRWFLDDCAEDQRRCRTEFPFEMRNRQRIEEAVTRLGETLSSDLVAQISDIDQRIRMSAGPAAFIWDPRLESVFPRSRYWYLYMLP